MACVMSAMIFASCGSKEYSDSKKALDDYESAISKASKCEDLDEADKKFFEALGEIGKKDYKNDTLSKEENDKLEKRMKEIEKKAEDKAKELKCD